MISVVVYGRNDAHGYNLHRRAALSLNCIAEVLTEPGDEIVFVDYNTPDELPTFAEAIADTLTDVSLRRLRVLRVPAAVHAERFAEHTHLPAVEPIARNAGVRRANPANRWILSTNTDMIFVPLVDGSLSEICGGLPDGYYGLPRFELPEWLWERLPRSDPARALELVTRLGPRLRLNEPTLSHDWIRFDAPGDFQLILREDYLAIDGLDEEMLLGYHVDSNVSRRLLLHRGEIGSVEDRVAGYHCNHNREPTVYHGADIVANDLVRFVVSVERAELPAQRTTWGLPDVDLEEVPIRERASTAFADVLVAAVPEAPGPLTPSRAGRVPLELTYDSGHVLPFVADSLAVSGLEVTVGYLGANPVLRGMLESAVERLGYPQPLVTASFDDPASVHDLNRLADVLVVDLGLDASLVDADPDEEWDGQPAPLPDELLNALDTVDELVSLERKRLEAGSHPRRFVLVHSWTVYWDAYTLANFECSHMTAHSRVRRASVRLVALIDEATRAAIELEQDVARWSGRKSSGRRLALDPSKPVQILELRDYAGFGDGWAHPDESGLWTQGSRAELSLDLDGVGDGDCVLGFSLGSICVSRTGTLDVTARVNGDVVATRGFHFGDQEWLVELPATARGEGIDLAFEIEGLTTPVALGWSTEDVRPLGINIRTIRLQEVDRSVDPGERVVFASGSGWERLLRDGWSHLEPTGVWSIGSTASLALDLRRVPLRDVEVTLAVQPFVSRIHPELRVEVSSGGQELAQHVFRHGPRRGHLRARLRRGTLVDLIRVPIPASARDAAGRVTLDLQLSDPVSPKELGLSEDTRALGVHLRWLVVR